MNHNLEKQIIAIGVASLMAVSASAGVTISSRSSAAAEFGQTIGYYPPPDDFYDNTANYTTLGSWSVTLPRGFIHASSVSNRSVSGLFRSSYSQQNGAYYSVSSTGCSLETTFAVTGSPVWATIVIDGFGTPATHDAQHPETVNAHVALFNHDTNGIVFDSFNLGAYTYFNQLYPTSRIEWDNVTSHVILPAGHYRLLIGAAHNDLWHAGPGMGWYASASIDATITFNCQADFNGDGLVDDSDFTIFVLAYDVLLCEDPAMPIGCPADLNGDRLVEDADFQIFGQAYDALLCP